MMVMKAKVERDTPTGIEINDARVSVPKSWAIVMALIVITGGSGTAWVTILARMAGVDARQIDSARQDIESHSDLVVSTLQTLQTTVERMSDRTEKTDKALAVIASDLKDIKNRVVKLENAKKAEANP
jgi:septal ring factor EnvC (AmiA/AmiB activator)